MPNRGLLSLEYLFLFDKEKELRQRLFETTLCGSCVLNARKLAELQNDAAPPPVLPLEGGVRTTPVLKAMRRAEELLNWASKLEIFSYASLVRTRFEMERTRLPTRMGWPLTPTDALGNMSYSQHRLRFAVGFTNLMSPPFFLSFANCQRSMLTALTSMRAMP